MSSLFGSSFLGSLLLAGALSSCLAGANDGGQDITVTQRLVGSVPLSHYSTDIVGVRVVSQGAVVASAKVDTAGNFDIAVPQGNAYTLELLGASGSYTLLAGPIDGPSPLTFDVCDPGPDFDLGAVNPLDFEEIDGDSTPWGNSQNDSMVPSWVCADGPGPEGSNTPDGNVPSDSGAPPDCFDTPLPCTNSNSDPVFCWDEPLPCDDANADPNFCMDSSEPCQSNGFGACEPPPEPCQGGNCQPPPPPEPCDSNGFGACEPPLEPCDSNGFGACEPAPPTCQGENCEPPVECVDGPNVQSEDPACWPAPDVCAPGPNGGFQDCDGLNGAAPSVPVPDFGCAV